MSPSKNLSYCICLRWVKIGCSDIDSDCVSRKGLACLQQCRSYVRVLSSSDSVSIRVRLLMKVLNEGSQIFLELSCRHVKIW